MENNPFQTREPSISGNPRLRAPQQEAYAELARFGGNPDEQEREVGIVLPVGCGKSGCITIAPFAFRATRTLVVAPGVKIAQQLHDDFDPARQDMFYIKCGVLNGPPYPEPAEIRGATTNRADLEEADVVLTNIHQLRGDENRWLQNLPDDFFDLILFDEGHHNVAQSWNTLKAKFARARIVNFSATPLRADGQLMAGRILYSYPVFRAIQEGYVKRLKAIVLNPQTLRYVRREDGQEIEVSLDEVRRLGAQDSDFRRSIVTSTETLNTIVDASIRELDKHRQAADDNRLKIIASALHYDHCRQVVEAYRARGRRADYVHSRENSVANDRVLQRLENHELDGSSKSASLARGLTTPFLPSQRYSASSPTSHPLFSSLAASCASSSKTRLATSLITVASSSMPEPTSPAGGPTSRCTAKPTASSSINFSLSRISISVPATSLKSNPRRVTSAMANALTCAVRRPSEEIPLIAEDPEALAALRVLRERGYSSDEVRQAYDWLEPVPVTRVRQRQAMRGGLDMRVRTETGRILGERGVNPEGHDFDRQRLGRTNFVVLKTAIDRQVNAAVGRQFRERHEFTRPEMDQIELAFTSIVERAVQEVFGAAN